MNNKQFKKKYIKWLLLILGLIGLAFGFFMINLINDNKNAAIRLTDSFYNYGPIEFNGEIYFPSNIDFPESRNTEVLAKVIPKDNSLIIELINQDILVGDREDANYTHLKTKGGDHSIKFSKTSFLENPTYVESVLKNHSKFELINDYDLKVTSIPLEQDLIVQLEDAFGPIEYSINDFNEYDKIYYIYVDLPDSYIESDNLKIAIATDPIYIGCIFSVNNELYYGNLNNPITGELSDTLKNLINDGIND